jgi:hypothetical protein
LSFWCYNRVIGVVKYVITINGIFFSTFLALGEETRARLGACMPTR